jgi:hypothetical protein
VEEDSLDEVYVDIPLPIETNVPPPIQLDHGENPDTILSIMMLRMTRNVRRKERMDAQNGKIKEQQRWIRELRNEVYGLLSDGARMQRVRESNTGYVFQSLKGYATGPGKWKRIAFELFTLKWITPYLIRHTVDDIRENVYTCDALAEATNRVPGFSLCYVEGFRGIQNVKKNTMKMVWSSGTIKNVHLQVEADMQKTIPMTLIDEIHDGEHVDGVKIDVAAIFDYILLKSSVFQKKRRMGR